MKSGTFLKSLFSSSASFHAGLPNHGLFHCSVLMLTYTHRLSGLACLTSVAGIKDNLAFQQARRGTGFAILTAVFTLWHIFLWRIRMSWKIFDQLWRLGDKSVHRRGSRSGWSGFGRTTFFGNLSFIGASLSEPILGHVTDEIFRLEVYRPSWKKRCRQ